MSKKLKDPSDPILSKTQALSILVVICGLCCIPPHFKQWYNETKEYSKKSWVENIGGDWFGDRWCIAKGFVYQKTLLGKTEAEVKEMLVFGKDCRFGESVRPNGQKDLFVMVNGHFRSGQFTVTLKDGRVIDQSLFETTSL